MDMKRVAAIADELDVPDGFVIARAGSPDRQLSIIVDGTVRLDHDGNRNVGLGLGDAALPEPVDQQLSGFPCAKRCLRTSTPSAWQEFQLRRCSRQAGDLVPHEVRQRCRAQDATRSGDLNAHDRKKQRRAQRMTAANPGAGPTASGRENRRWA
jgi:hypothetical protein